MSDQRPDDDSGVATDGRTARRDRNRDAVLDAVLDMFREGAIDPNPAEVAERSGVSRRSVYRYFEDMEALVRAAMDRHYLRIVHLFEMADLGVGPLDGRIERMVSQRVHLFDAVGPMARVALARARTNELIRERMETNRHRLQDQLEAMFAPELRALPVRAAKEVAAALEVLLGFEAVDFLLQERDLAVAGAERVLRRAVTAILTAAP